MKKFLITKFEETFSKSPTEITELLSTLNVEKQTPKSKTRALSELKHGQVKCGVKLPTSELSTLSAKKHKEVINKIQQTTSESSLLCEKEQKEVIHEVQTHTSESSLLCAKKQKEVIHEVQKHTSESSLLCAKKQKEVIHEVQKHTSESSLLCAKKQKEVIHEVQKHTSEQSTLSVMTQIEDTYHEELPISELSALSVKNPKEAKSTVQPPLPLQPPLPDNSLTIILKKEIENDEYQSNTQIITEKSPDCISNEESTNELKLEPPRVITTPAMCRRFVRGTCTKGDKCIFDHNVDPKQLKGIFKFCWDFQNRECCRQKCKHMHGSIFEEQRFYRKGYLPQHVLDHYFSSTNILLPHLAPRKEDVPKFSSPPSVLSTNMIPLSTISSVNSMEQKPEEVLDKQPLKRKWKDLDSGSPSWDIDTCEPLAKKCKNCAAHEYRLQFNKDKLDGMMDAWLEFEEKIDLLNKKTSKLQKFIKALNGAGLLSDDSSGTLKKFSKYTKI